MQPNWQNRTLFHGDNLTFLRAMNSESVDLIATDPPFNKGRDFPICEYDFGDLETLEPPRGFGRD